MSKQNNDIRVQLAALFEEHDYNKRYERLSVVYYMVDGKIEFYQAIKDVPRFTPISDTRVWNKSSNAILTSSEEPAFDNDFIPVYFPPETGEQVPSYYLEPVDDNVFVIITAYYVIPNQTTQPEITGIKINNIPYTIVLSEDAEPAPGLAIVEGDTMFMPIDAEMYQEIQYMKQIGVDIDANIGDGLFVVIINAFSDTAPSGPITFELNTDVGNCTIIVPEYVEPKQSYIYVTRDDTYDIGFSNYYSYDYNDTQAWASYLESDFGDETTITIFGTSIVCTGWQESSDGETWTDIPNSATNELEVTVPEGNYYYKPIVVDSSPNWVEISRELDGNYSNCITDADNFNTGMCNKSVTVTYQDQNPYSSSYNQTRTGTDYTEIEDLVSCPIPQIINKSIHVNVWTEYDDNGTIVTNDVSKATVQVYACRYNSSPFNHSPITVPFNDTIRVLETDTNYEVGLNISLESGYCIKGIFTRNDVNSEWVEFYSNGWFDYACDNININTIITKGLYEPYIDIKIELVQSIERSIKIKSIVIDNGIEYNISSNIYIQTSNGNIRGYHTNNNTLFTYRLPADATLITTPQNDAFINKEVYEQYVRYSENDNWIQVTPQHYYPLDANHNYFEIKYVLRPVSLQVDVHFATASTVNGETVYNIDDTLGTLYTATIGDTQLVGVDYINVGTNTFSNLAYNSYYISISAIPSQTSNTPLSNIQCLVRHSNQDNGNFGPYSGVNGTIITPQNTDSYIKFDDINHYLGTDNVNFHYPNKVEILVVFTPEQQSGGTTPVYQKVTSAPANGDWSGEYLIVNGNYDVFRGSLADYAIIWTNTTDMYSSFFDNDMIPATIGQTDLQQDSFTITGSNNDWQLRANSGAYIYVDNGMTSAGQTPISSSVAKISINLNNDGSANIICHNYDDEQDYTLAYMSNLLSISFIHDYELASSQPIYLYKKVLI